MEIAGRLAVVTGGGSGMGRELVVQLATGGCDVATCDVHEPSLAETGRILVGDDARALDEAVRADPLAVYGADGLALRSITG
jgi:NAD(P)-dependent dehydrogenase (short-subunit alcohol dehydrogenase family)